MTASTTLTLEPPPTPSAQPLRVVAVSPTTTTRARLVPGGSLTIGSGIDADVQVTDPTVSALHCQLSIDRGVLVEDLGSRNGTYVLGAQVSRAWLVGERPEFRIGATTIRIEAVAKEGETLGLVGRSDAIRRLRETIERYAASSAPVLVLGESGTGKDLVARALHERARRAGQYLALNVSTFPDSLLDSELFGHVRGAFTGAVGDRKGAFETANEGTLFLDEIGDLSPSGQAKLLRVVEDGLVRPLGAKTSVRVATRIVSATCVPLAERVRAGNFRLDLFHRLGTLVIEMPPLRERLVDVPLLAAEFFRRREEELGPRVLDRGALRALGEYRWPGNVRELFSTLYRAALHAPAGVLRESDLFRGGDSSALAGPLTPETAEELVRRAGSVAAAARLASVPRSTFRDRLRRGGVEQASATRPSTHDEPLVGVVRIDTSNG